MPGVKLDYQVAGINHMAFYLKLAFAGEDLYPRLQRLAEAGQVPAANRVRYEMLRRLGYFVTESSEHFAEYVPWFIKGQQPELVDRYTIPLDEYPRRCEQQMAEWEALSRRLTDPAVPLAVGPSQEYGASIINAIETGVPTVVYGNVANDRLIENLPEGCCVEVPCLVDHNGVQPVRVGALPPHLAALMQTNINVQVADGGGRPDRTAGPRISRRHARPAHGRGIEPRSDRGAGGRDVRGASGLVTGHGFF